MRFLLASAVALALLGSSSPALANGRFPESNQITFSATDPDLVLVRVTFGLLVSHDRGRTFDWVCEQSVGYNGVEDPMYAVTKAGAFVGSTFEGITVSNDKACSWSLVEQGLKGQVFSDLAASPKDPDDIVGFSSTYDRSDDAGNIFFASNVFETKDGTKTFTKLGSSLDPALLGHTIDLSIDPNRLYVTAVRDPGPNAIGVLLTSKDHGVTWDETDVPLETGEHSLFIAAVDPTDAERVYIRTKSDATKPARLLLREAGSDGGSSIRVIYASKDSLAGFALAPDGKKVWIGSTLDGLLVASTTDFQFTKKSDLQVQCLALGAEGLWACSNEQNGFIAGLSTDEGATFEPRVRFCTIRGPLACPVGTSTNDTCAPIWAQQRNLLGCTDEVAADASIAGDGGTTPAVTPTTPHATGGCAASPAGPWGALVAFVGVALALVRRTRRGCQPPPAS